MKGAGIASRALAAFKWLGLPPAEICSGRHCPSIQSQNIPNTTAVRKAKDMMAASTLSRVCSSITASFAGPNRPLTQVSPRQHWNLWGRITVGQHISMLQCNNSMVKVGVSQLPHPMVHDNNFVFSLIQEALVGQLPVFINY